MIVKKLKVGYAKTNCYLLFKGEECLIVDPGAESDKIIKEIGNKIVKGILATHSHFDHIGALKTLKDHYKCNVYRKDNLVEKQYIISNFNFEVIYTPGHTDDSISFYFDKKFLFTGDFLFKGMIGRYDFLTSSYNDLIGSLNKLKKYPPHVIIYPGHGINSILLYEFTFNSHFKSKNLLNMWNEINY